MLSWIDTHGIVMMIGWGFLLIVAGSIPPLSDKAGFWAKWGYAILKTISLNSRGISNALNIKIPELNLETIAKKTDKGE